MIAAKISRAFHCMNCQSEPMSILRAAFFFDREFARRAREDIGRANDECA
jgi:hypothetical protein